MAVDGDPARLSVNEPRWPLRLSPLAAETSPLFEYVPHLYSDGERGFLYYLGKVKLKEEGSIVLLINTL